MSQMITPVILAGGAGTRLWPLSQPSRPKQFHSFDGVLSLFQHTVSRVRPGGRFTPPIIVTNVKYFELVQQELKALEIEPGGIILEPEGRNTAPAIALAILYARRHGLGPQLLVLPSDHLINDKVEMNRAIVLANDQAARGYIVTFGVRPSYPATGFGYIKTSAMPGAVHGEVLFVEAFVEKPDLKSARRFLKHGLYLWNSGMFQFHIDTMADELKRHCSGLYAAVQCAFNHGTDKGKVFIPDGERFALLKSISIDYAVMEKTRSATVVPVDPAWSDVGTWAAVWESSQQDSDGNVLTGNVSATACWGCYVHSGQHRIMTVGLEDIVVVAHGDSILVARKDMSQDIGRLSKFSALQPGRNRHNSRLQNQTYCNHY